MAWCWFVTRSSDVQVIPPWQSLVTSASRQRAVQTTSTYLHWCGADPPSSLSTPAPSLAMPAHGPPKRGHFSVILAGCVLSVWWWRGLRRVWQGYHWGICLCRMLGLSCPCCALCRWVVKEKVAKLWVVCGILMNRLRTWEPGLASQCHRLVVFGWWFQMPGPCALLEAIFFSVFEFVGRKRRHNPTRRMSSCFRNRGLFFHYLKEFSDVSCTDDPSRHRAKVGVGTGGSLFAARSRKNGTQNGRRNGSWNPRWLSQVSFQTAAHLKRDLNLDHLEFWFHFESQAFFSGTGCIIFWFFFASTSGWASNSPSCWKHIQIFVCLFVCKAGTPLNPSTRQEHIQVVCSNRVACWRPAQMHSHNGPWTQELCFEEVYVSSGLRNCMIVEYSECVSGLRWMCCGGSVAWYIECTNVGFMWRWL